MKKIGITGQSGFIGKHLRNTLNLFRDDYLCVNFNRSFFNDEIELDNFVRQCDVIVHLAAVNRHNDPGVIYATNIGMVKSLISSLVRTGSNAHVIFSSSLQEESENPYGKSKKDGRDLLIEWSEKSNGKLTGMVIPNVFGPFGRPYYNSVIATFSHQLSCGEAPEIQIDSLLKLIYVGELVKEIIQKINSCDCDHFYQVSHSHEAKVSELLATLKLFKNEYQCNGVIPAIQNEFDLNLFNTFRSYIDIKNYFPVKLMKNLDARGTFVEVVRLHVGGQVSFSTTKPGITRGDHFHTRKIERFAVIKGKALIQLRQIGTDEIISFELSGAEPAYVDMPIWYTHNIKNIGDDELFTNFWINEFYNPEDPDTYFEKV